MMMIMLSFAKRSCLLLLVMLFADTQLFAQKVSGTVSDETGQPVPGANVVVKGTTNGNGFSQK